MSQQRKKRGARGSVSTFQTSKGLWRARFSYVDPDSGQNVRADITRKNQNDLKAAVKDIQSRSEQGLSLKDSRQTLASWVGEWQNHRLKESGRKLSTQELYRNLSNTHLAGSPIANMPLAEIKPIHLTRLFASFTESGLSASTKRTIYAVARAIFEDAVSDGLIVRSPMVTLKRPRSERVEARYLNTEEVSAILESLAEGRFYSPVALAALTGMRRGEILGLEWENIDFEKRVARVRATMNRVDGKLSRTEPKTRNSRRDIPLTASALELLRKQKIAQSQERLKAGGFWKQSNLVFTTDTGAPIDGRNMLRAFKEACKRTGIEGAGIHALRHFAATSLLDAQVPVLVVSRILGHSSLAITADIYGHVIEETAIAAMDTLGTKVTLRQLEAITP